MKLLQIYTNNNTRCALECLNGGQCAYISEDRAPYCVCSKPYHGPKCEYKFACIPACQNGGVCEFKDSGPYCKCSPSFEGQACDSIIARKINKEQNRSDYSIMLNIIIAIIFLVLVLVAVGATYLFVKNRRLFSHERLQENDFNNPAYQDRDAEPFTLAADRVSH